VAAYAVCLDAGRLLLARFVGRHGDRHWMLPGGWIEHGEDPYHAVVREVAEETGYDVEVELLGIHSARHTYPRGRWAVADHHTVRVMYTARIVGGELRNEVSGSTDLAAWIPIDRLDELAAKRANLVDAGLELVRNRPPTGHL
jgi:8-oxo-dGTP diphosphatase